MFAVARTALRPRAALVVRSLSIAPASLPKPTARPPALSSRREIQSGPALPPGAIPDLPITTFLAERWRTYGDKTAIIDGVSGRSVPFSELEPRVLAAASKLRAAGFAAGDTLQIHMPNCPEYLIAFHAALVLGGTVSTSNPLYTPHELAHQIADAETRHVITIDMFAPVVAEALALAKSERGHDGAAPVSVLGAPGAFVDVVGGAVAPADADLAAGVGAAHAPVAPSEHVAVLPYSSGTTGLPKGVMLTHRNVVANLVQMFDAPEPYFDSRPDDVGLALLPMFHIYGMVVVLHGALHTGATIVTLPKFEPELFLQTMAARGVTLAYLVPPIVLFLAKHPAARAVPLPKLRSIFSGAAPLDAETQLDVTRTLGVPVVQGYGMTEMSPVSHGVKMAFATDPPSFDAAEIEPWAGNVGLPLPGMESKIVDPSTFDELPAGEVGELWCRGPNVMKGYLGRPEATAETLLADGWMRTGDLARENDGADGALAGTITVVDRLKELIKVKGFQVAPAELEGLLLSHPEVADCAVIPEKDARVEGDERPFGYVVLKPGATVDEAGVLAFVAGRAAEFKHLSGVSFVAEIPKSAAGKILRRVLRDQHNAGK